MRQGLTERAHKAILFAREEAARLGEDLCGTEHLLLGLIRDEDSVAVRILRRMGADLDRIRSEIGKQTKSSARKRCEDIQLTPQAKSSVEAAYREAERMNNAYVGTEHLLLGLVAEGDGVAGRLLSKFGVRLEKTRKAVEDLQESKDPTVAVDSRGTQDVMTSLKRHDLISIRDLKVDDIWGLFALAERLKALPIEEQIAKPILPGKTLAMIFEKPSLRTRVTFEVAMTHLGGHAVYLAPSDIQMGKRESVADTARNLSRWVDGIMARVFAHDTVAELAKWASVPVINGLSDLEHPCQALADFFTIYEKKRELEGLKLAFVGDGCNTCNSLMLLAAKLGVNMSVGCPVGYEPDTAITLSAKRDARATGATISILNDPFEAVHDANVIYTDVWASMGLETEAEMRKPLFAPFQVNQRLVDAAAEDVIILHCLPAHRGEEITDDVIDGPRSAVLDEAENRLHIQKAIMACLM